MFTGIVEEVGNVLGVDLSNPEQGLAIAADLVLENTQVGDSIAINGACLTVTGLSPDRFTVGVVPETVRRTNLGTLMPGDQVNLERALQPQSHLGGHFVQGHVDGTGTVASVAPDGNGLVVRIETSPTILRYVVEKGFVAVDGISLTVTDVDDRGFGVSLVPYTRSHVAPGLQTMGQQVNLEVDILAKYVEKLVLH